MSEESEAIDDHTLQAIEAIRLLNDALPEMPYPPDWDFEFYEDLSFPHYEQVLGDWVIDLLQQDPPDSDLLPRIFEFAETMATSENEHREALICTGFCEHLAFRIPRLALRTDAAERMGPRTKEMFEYGIEFHQAEGWGARVHGDAWLA